MIKIFFLLIPLSLTSCALKNSVVSLQPTLQKQVIEKPFNIPLYLTIQDLRSHPDVGYIQNFLGMRIAKILLKQPLKETLEKSLKDRFTSQGYSLTENPDAPHIHINIDKCYTQYDERIFRRKAIADLCLTLQRLDSHHNVLYSKKIHTEGQTSPFLRFSSKTVQKALDQALSKALQACTEDTKLLNEKNP